MTSPIGEIPAIAEQRRRACDVRRALMRRYAESENEHGEGALTAALAERFIEAVKEGDRAALEIARAAITEICGPQRQAVDLQAKIYSVVRITGEDDDEV